MAKKRKEKITITPSVLTWARERAGYKADQLAAKCNSVDISGFERGDDRPTYREIEAIADKLQLPVAVFLLPEPPDWPPIEETFRTLGSEQFAEIPPRIRLLLHKARGFQISLDELNNGRNPALTQIARDLPLHPTTNLVAAAKRIREYLGVSFEDQFGWTNAAVALKAWRSAFYKVGVSVFKDAFGDDNYCGFCLYDTEFPVIYVNNSNAKTRQIFTIFHELAHLLHKTSGVDRRDAFKHGHIYEHAEIEKRCNALANAILVPASALDNDLQGAPASREEAERLAKRFRVSSTVIYRNFRDRGLIAQTEYESFIAEQNTQWQNRHLDKKKRGGGDSYRTRLAYLGEDYVELAFRRYYEERIDDEELAEYLNIPPKQIDKLEQTFLGER
ncbi:MAG: XRE family transcriptional regulator [Chloroflexi bacterium]|nr:XRE family transcriptional regulator [Chloroflexota bacterium]